jgi:hypothetical protein
MGRLAIAAILLGFVLLKAATAQLTMTGIGGGGFGGGGGGGSPTFTVGTGLIFNNGYAAGYTFTGLNSGVNWPSGALVVISACNSDSVAMASPTIGGNAATLLARDSTTTVEMYYAVMPSSSPDTFSFTNALSINFLGAAAVYMQNLASSTPDSSSTMPYGNQADPQTTTGPITVVGSGFGVAMGCALGQVATPTWNVGTGVINVTYTTTHQLLVAKMTASGTPSVSGTPPYNFAMGMVAGSWH